jgi:hypothetical protein
VLNYVRLGIVGVNLREYEYIGPEKQPPRVRGLEGKDVGLSLENATAIIRKAWGRGRLHVGTHIKKRMAQRKVDMIDLENVIRNGVVSSSKYDEEYKNWKYRMVGTTDGRNIEVIIALDPTEDYEASPLAVLVTVFDQNEVPGAAKQGG